MATINEVQALVNAVENRLKVPKSEVWLHVGGSYGNTTLDIFHIDWNNGKTTTGVTRLYTGTKNGLYDCLRFLLETTYQIERNKTWRREGRAKQRNQVQTSAE